MTALVAVLATLLVVGFLWACSEGSQSSWGGWEPAADGCFVSMVGLIGLLALALMRLGAWIWGGG